METSPLLHVLMEENLGLVLTVALLHVDPAEVVSGEVAQELTECAVMDPLL